MKKNYSPDLGIYKIKWKKKCGGGSSVASIYMDMDGNDWIAPSNWVGPAKWKDAAGSIKKLIRK